MHCWSHLAFSTSKAAAVLLQDTLFRRIWHTINGGGLVTLRPLNPLFLLLLKLLSNVLSSFVVVAMISRSRLFLLWETIIMVIKIAA